MKNKVLIKIDGVDFTSLVAEDGLSFTYSWISTANRNANDYMIISNPVKKRSYSITFIDLTEAQYNSLIKVIGKKDICHTLTVYDEFEQKQVSIKVYNSDLSGGKSINKNKCLMYKGVTFSLIER